MAVGEDIVPDLVLDVDGADLEAIDEEAEIRGREGGGLVEVVGGKELSDVNGSQEDVHGAGEQRALSPSSPPPNICGEKN